MAKDNYIRIRVSSEFKTSLKQRAVEADMEITDYIISCLDTNPVIVLGGGKEIAAAFYEFKNVLISKDINAIKNNNSIIEKGKVICRLLNSLMQEISVLKP